MNCPKCNKELVWGGEHSYEDEEMEGEGIVLNNTCLNEDCDVETVIIYIRLDE